MKVIGSWEEWDIVLRSMLKYMDALKNKKDGDERITITMPNFWAEENTSEQVESVYDNMEFILDDE